MILFITDKVFSVESSSISRKQIKRLSTIATRLFRRGDYWNMANTPAIYWSGANLSDYSTVPTKEIQSVMDMVTRMADKMNGGQLAVIYTKVNKTKTQFFLPDFFIIF